MTDTIDILTYVMGGRGSFTLTGKDSGKHITYRVRWNKEHKTAFVSFLSAPDTYSYLGVLDFQYDDQGDLVADLRLTAKSQATWTAHSTRGMAWLLKQCCNIRELPSTMKFQHSGQCCKCGRELTTPESLERGIGPICATLV